jgi:ABC-type siderophore export system fused ATPase/permease subunit
MNDIILLLWLSDLVVSLSAASAMGALGLSLVAVFTHMFYGMDNKKVPGTFNKVYYAIGLCLVILVVTPSANTMRMLVVGKAGQIALNTELGKKTIEAAEAVLNKVITEAKK